MSDDKIRRSLRRGRSLLITGLIILIGSAVTLAYLLVWGAELDRALLVPTIVSMFSGVLLILMSVRDYGDAKRLSIAQPTAEP